MKAIHAVAALLKNVGNRDDVEEVMVTFFEVMTCTFFLTVPQFPMHLFFSFFGNKQREWELHGRTISKVKDFLICHHMDTLYHHCSTIHCEENDPTVLFSALIEVSFMEIPCQRPMQSN